MTKEGTNRRLVMERTITLASGNKAVVQIYDTDETVPKSDVERHQACVENMQRVAASIFLREAQENRQKESAQSGGNRD